MLYKGLDLLLDITGYDVVFQKDTVVEHLVPAVVTGGRGFASMIYVPSIEKLGQFDGDLDWWSRERPGACVARVNVQYSR